MAGERSPCSDFPQKHIDRCVRQVGGGGCSGVDFCLYLGKCCCRRLVCVGGSGAMAAGAQTQTPAEVAAQTTVAGMCCGSWTAYSWGFCYWSWLEWVYFQSLPHSLPVALQTCTNTHVHTCTHTALIHRVFCCFSF